MSRALAAVVLLAAAAGCGSRVTALGDSTLTVENAFYLMLDENGRFVRASQPFGIAAGTVTYGMTSIALGSNEARALLVAFDDLTLAARARDFESARRAELKIIELTPVIEL